MSSPHANQFFPGWGCTERKVGGKVEVSDKTQTVSQGICNVYIDIFLKKEVNSIM